MSESLQNNQNNVNVTKSITLQSTPVTLNEQVQVVRQGATVVGNVRQGATVIQKEGVVVQQVQVPSVQTSNQVVYLQQQQQAVQYIPVQVQQVQPQVIQKIVPQVVYQTPPELTSELERLQLIINQYYEEITTLKAKILSYEQHILITRGVEEKNQTYIVEIDRLTKIINEKLLIINELQVQLFNKEKLLSETELDRDQKENEKRSKQRDVQNLAQENLRLSQLLQEREREIYSLKLKLQDLSLIDEYKVKLDNYIKEINSLHIVISERQNEFNSLNEKYHSLSVSFDISRQNWDSKSTQLTSEVELLRNQLNRRTVEYDDAQRQIAGLNQLVADLRSFESKYNELNVSYSWQIQENQRLKDRVADYDFLFDQHEQVKKSSKKAEQDNQNLLRILQQQDEELERLKQQIVSLNATISQNQIFESRYNEANVRINVLVTENDRIRADLASILQQNETYRQQLVGLENVNADLNNQLKIRISENQRQIELYQIKVRDIEALQAQLRQSESRVTHITILESKIQDQQRTIASLTEELNHYRNIVVERQQQIDGLLIKITDIEKRSGEIRVFETRYYDIQKQYTALLADLEVYKKRYEQDQARISELSQTLVLRQQEIDSLNQRNMNFEVNIKQTYITEIKNLESRYNESQIRIANLLKEIETLNLMLKDNKVNAEQLNRYQAQIAQLQNVITRQESEISSLNILKVSSADYQSKILLLTQEIERLNKQISQLVNEIDQQRVKYSSMELTYKSYEDKHYVLNAEIDRLNALLREQENDLRIWRGKYGEYTLLYKANQEHLSLFVLMSAEIENLRRRLDQKDYEVEEARRFSLSYYKQK